MTHAKYATPAEAIAAADVVTDISHAHGVGAGLDIIATFQIKSEWIEWDGAHRNFWEHTATLDAPTIGALVFHPADADRLFYPGFRKAIEAEAAIDYAADHAA